MELLLLVVKEQQQVALRKSKQQLSRTQKLKGRLRQRSCVISI